MGFIKHRFQNQGNEILVPETGHLITRQSGLLDQTFAGRTIAADTVHEKMPKNDADFNVEDTIQTPKISYREELKTVETTLQYLKTRVKYGNAALQCRLCGIVVSDPDYCDVRPGLESWRRHTCFEMYSAFSACGYSRQLSAVVRLLEEEERWEAPDHL
ncbi:hypothetical protein TNCV_1324521 [Trichonephila clavipes]|nr:hypothetical protein TNCV_1324521 [Trichonephila clavipes]